MYNFIILPIYTPRGPLPQQQPGYSIEMKIYIIHLSLLLVKHTVRSVYVFSIFFPFLFIVFDRPNSTLIGWLTTAGQFGHILCWDLPQWPMFIYTYMAAVGCEPHPHLLITRRTFYHQTTLLPNYSNVQSLYADKNPSPS